MTEGVTHIRTVEIFFELIRYELCGKELSDSARGSITEEKLKMLLKSARGHDIAQIVEKALAENKLLGEGEIAEKFEREAMLALYRYQSLERELGDVSKILSEEKIPFVPLKGSVIREFYPQPWMRTSCDIDILIQDGDVDKAVKAITEGLGYKVDGNRNFHDVSLHSPSGVHLELHFNLLENRENIDRLLSKAWDHAYPIAENGFEYAFTNEFLLFHIISHMAYHFVHGGCGVRPFIDLWLLEKKLEYDKDILGEMLKKCELEKFYNTVSKLCRVWLECEPHDEITMETERFILLGGVFGAKSKAIAAKQTRSGGKLSYFMERIFQPYSIIKEKYPVLKKYPIFTPAYEVKRWFDLLRRGKLERLHTEIGADKNVSSDEISEMNLFLDKLGL